MPDFTSPELPVEDALEQEQDTVRDDDTDAVTPTVAVTYDASDADLLEQSRDVPLDDEHDR
ncbi:hypothetical protein HQ305_01560 [Rhodococcus sp. BP-149]|uniref:hypothetical protein n=1 Tax=unclassified Rhodococcus (in: high G+C Gram-positive bacteria) TaxID=192944 RepID=UPI001C9A9C3F|nr:MULTISPECIES: hypothetical protein [unclassified Rhodococcus (in: high G+C Gram-positive bacteria)]MBY6684894.1 hypothetical protein [Rhodococcus sp. BP-288]MBY6692622.1 hypothetical protein [Rhodococcus sp. BP-188]MBY6698520.1 hypothetical protein [Rhodococcus sp. BP-285]MBY6701199.1 hypothetical protein [Rhodococcus sp. BP-283]MBY6712200.1 hypothetical protein [Rhodococcus sp. BP-160]